MNKETIGIIPLIILAVIGILIIIVLFIQSLINHEWVATAITGFGIFTLIWVEIWIK